MTQQTWAHTDLDEEELSNATGGYLPGISELTHAAGQDIKNGAKDFVKHPVTQSFGAGIAAGLAIKGVQYAVHH